MPEFTILAGAAVKGSLVLGVAAAAAWCLRGRSAAARHLVWTAAAAALLALPFLTATMPALRVQTESPGAMAVFSVLAGTQADGSGGAQAVATAQAPAGTPQAARQAAVLNLRRWAITVWIAGVVLGLLQMALAWFAVARLRRKSQPMDDLGLAAELGIEHPVDVLESDRAVMPMTCGVLRPAVLMPVGASDWNVSRLRVVLLHELAHVRRGDVATHLLARTALAVYWWNPLAWLAWREFLKERERATDDLVLHAGERASEYAQHLLEVAKSLAPLRSSSAAALAMARKSELEGRLVAILDAGVNRRPSGRRAALAVVLGTVALVAPFAAIQAQDPALPAEVEATIRAANAQKNHEMLDRAAAGYEKIAKLEVARKLLESSLTLREQAGSAEYAVGLVKLGDLAAKRGQPEEAEAFYRKAVSLGDRPEVAGALVYLGQWSIYRDRTAAEELLNRALRLESTGPNAGKAWMWLAVMRQSSWLGESEAELFFQKSLAADPQNATAMQNYSRFLRRQNRITDAEQVEARANDVLHPAKPVQAAVNSAGVYRVGGGVSSPSLLFKKEPEYSEAARAAKFQGTVLLYVEIAPDGTAQNIQVQRGLGLGLDEKAIESVRQWRFKPGTKDGTPVTVQATIEVNFRLM